MSVFIIAEAGSSHDNDLAKAHRLIEAAKECGADACKFQFWSNSKALADRRKLGKDAEAVYAKYKLPQGWLPILANLCEKKGIEFMCTSYLIEDIPIIAPYVKRFKVSAFESDWQEFNDAHYLYRKPVIISKNHERVVLHDRPIDWKLLYCVSEYPTPLDRLHLSRMTPVEGYDGFSDHTANVLTGAAAVAAGAQIIEAHIRLGHTNADNPDFPHSLVADVHPPIGFRQYVRNIREVERML